jgi:oligoribonuclease (3'-5' exoribonuclease)
MPDEKDISEYARALGKRGGLKGGRARAEALTPEQRSEIAQKAAQARWGSNLPKATHEGMLKIGDRELPCYVLEDGRRVFSTRGVNRALGSTTTGTPKDSPDGARKLPAVLSSKSLKPFIDADLMARLLSPIEFRPKAGRSAFGFEATLLPDICEAILDAAKADVLKQNQRRLAETAEILIRAFAKVGIIALVDEATGYQAERDRDALHKILEAYIADELLPWAKRFPDEFYKQLFRLREWQYSPLTVKRPQYVGKLTNQLVYEKLPPGVLEELKRLNPVIKNGWRKHRHHQFLTENIGNPHLERHLAAITTLMRASSDWHDFVKLFRRAFPTAGAQIPFDFEEDSRHPGQGTQIDYG